MNYIANRITVDADLCNGRPTIRGMRITVQTILEFLFAGDTSEDILEQYPTLEQADIDACQAFALSLMERQRTVNSISSSN